MSLLTPTEKKKVRAAIANYLLRCEHSRSQIHYAQTRPYHHLGVTPEHGFTADCSSLVTGAFFWGSDQSNFPVRDPNGRGWDGYGYTGTLLTENIHASVPADHKCFVGDMGIYGTAWHTKHVVICRAGGSRESSIWTSHGSESGPVPVRLNYRSDLLGVFRGKSLL